MKSSTGPESRSGEPKYPQIGGSFRPIKIKEIDAAHAVYMEVYEWLNAKGVRQWLRPLPRETFAERQRDGQLFALFSEDDRVAAVVTLAFEPSQYWVKMIGEEEHWWIKSLAVCRACRGEGIGKRVTLECEAAARESGASEMFIDCVAGGFLPPYYAALGYETLHHAEITYPSGNTFPMVLMRKELDVPEIANETNRRNPNQDSEKPERT